MFSDAVAPRRDNSRGTITSEKNERIVPKVRHLSAQRCC